MDLNKTKPDSGADLEHVLEILRLRNRIFIFNQCNSRNDPRNGNHKFTVKVKNERQTGDAFESYTDKPIREIRQHNFAKDKGTLKIMRKHTILLFVSIFGMIITSLSITGLPISANPYSAYAALNSPDSHSSQSSQYVQIISSCNNSGIDVFVPLNSTNFKVYPNWNIHMFGSGEFSFYVNGSLIESGQSIGSYSMNYTFAGRYANASLMFLGVAYSFNDTIVGALSSQEVQSVSIVSYFSNQNQYFTVPAGRSGALMYPNWIITLTSTQQTNYSIFIDGSVAFSGSFKGTKAINDTIAANTVTVAVSLGKNVYNFPDELIAHEAVARYYGPQPPSLAYTASQYEYAIAKGFMAALFGLAVSFLIVRKYVIEKKKRDVVII